MGRNGSGVIAISETSIEITFAYRGQRCRERIKLKPTAPNLKRAERHRAAILDAIEKGTFNYSETFPDSPRRLLFIERQGDALKVAAYLDAWLDRQEKHLKSSTWDDYRKIVNNPLVPKLGGLILADLKRTHVREMCDGIDASNKRLANVQSVLRSALQAAFDDELIEANILHRWTYSRKEAVKEEDDVDPFTQAEQTAILEKCTGQTRNTFKFYFWTGIRPSELVALRWGDIDWLRGVVVIQRARTQVAKEAEGTKTKAGRREVKLLAPALEALIDQKAYTYLKGEEIFNNPRTELPWKGDQPIRQAWTPILKLAKVRYRRPYQTRHTYASMMLSAGEHPMWVAQQMGHKDWTMIARIYGKWMPSVEPEAGNKAVAAFTEKLANKLALPSPSDPNQPQKKAS
ncbi:MAG: site-specific integrase [Rhodocyclales bacterium]|nr:site-specific integrase [Rhodocyclales bacterium]